MHPRSMVAVTSSAEVTRSGDEIHIMLPTHHWVRSLVGIQKLVGEGRWTADGLQATLEARNRAGCGPVTPPSGLYPVRVDCPA